MHLRRKIAAFRWRLRHAFFTGVFAHFAPHIFDEFIGRDHAIARVYIGGTHPTLRQIIRKQAKAVAQCRIFKAAFRFTA